MCIQSKDIGRLRNQGWALRSALCTDSPIAVLRAGEDRHTKLFKETRNTFIQVLRSTGKKQRLPIHDEWLRVVLGSWVLSDDGLAHNALSAAVRDNGDVPPDRGTLDLLDSVAAMCLRLLGWIELNADRRIKIMDIEARGRFLQRDVKDIDYAKAASRVICAFVQHMHHVNYGLCPPGRFDPAANLETLLYAMRPQHRDHLWHAFDVTLLGLVILSTQRSDGKTWAEALAPAAEERDSLLRNWCVAGLYHDVGYGLAVLPRGASELRAIQSFEIDQFTTESERAITDAINRFNSRVSMRAGEVDLEIPLLSDLDHGVASFSHLLYLLKRMPSHDILVKDLKPALRAVLYHNLSDVEIDAKKDPVSALLVVCDEVQDWHRERVECSDLREHVIADILFPSSHFLIRTPLVREAWLDVATKENGDLIQSSANLSVEISYVSADEGKYLPQYLWLARARAFQRIAIDHKVVFPPFRVTSAHPFTRRLKRIRDDVKGRGIPKTEFDLLTHFVQEQGRTEMLERWREAGNVESKVKPDATAETLSISLRDLRKTRPVQFPLGDILDGFPAWRDSKLRGLLK